MITPRAVPALFPPITGVSPATWPSPNDFADPMVVDHGRETDPLMLKLADQTYAGTDGFAAWLAELAKMVDI